MHSIMPLFPGLPGGPELLIVLFVLVLLFGANKIPKLARSTGQAMGEFRRGREEIEEELNEVAGEGEGEATAEPSTDSASRTVSSADEEEEETEEAK
jgi:sec-independent protein translocase protein TatA